MLCAFGEAARLGLAACKKNSEQTDGTLLRAFLSTKDEATFEVLVRRHGPMVLRVCRRTLGNAHDAEDVMQAVFVVLAQHAPSIRKKESLASWLRRNSFPAEREKN